MAKKPVVLDLTITSGKEGDDGAYRLRVDELDLEDRLWSIPEGVRFLSRLVRERCDRLLRRDDVTPALKARVQQIITRGFEFRRSRRPLHEAVLKWIENVATVGLFLDGDVVVTDALTSVLAEMPIPPKALPKVVRELLRITDLLNFHDGIGEKRQSERRTIKHLLEQTTDMLRVELPAPVKRRRVRKKPHQHA